MKKNYLFPKNFWTVILLTQFLSLFNLNFANAQNWLWAKSTSADINSVVVDVNGNSYVTGFFRDTVIFGNTTLISAGGSDIFVVKFNDLGLVQWARKAGSILNDVGRGIGTDGNGNIYVAGYFSEDYDSGATASCVFGGSTVFSSGETEIFLAKYDSTGLLKWVRSAGGQGFDYCDALSVDASGNCFITGSFGYDFYNGFGGINAVFSTVTLSPVGQEDVYVAMYNDAGLLIWTEQGAGADQARAFSITNDGSGNAFISGVSFGGVVFDGNYLENGYFFAKCNSLGWQWSRGCQSVSGNSFGISESVDSSGNSYSLGEIDEDAIFGFDTLHIGSNGSNSFIIKYDALGSIEWAKAIGGNYSFGVNEIHSGLNGNVLLGGAFQDTLLLLNDTLISHGLDDIGIVEIDSTGNILNARSVGGIKNDQCVDLAIDQIGNLYLIGGFNDTTSVGPFTFNDTSQISYIAKFGQTINVGAVELNCTENFINVFPNPSSHVLNIAFSLLKSDKICIRIYDFTGKLVNEISEKYFNSGNNLVEWNTTNSKGDPVATGIYSLRIEAENYFETKNICITR